MSIQINSNFGLITDHDLIKKRLVGGHVRNVGGGGFSLGDFEKYANYLNSREVGCGDALIKFGKLDGATVLRIASVEKDHLFSCDIKDPLFRTKKTKAVNNDVRKTFVRALENAYKGADFDVRSLIGNPHVKLEDFVDEGTMALLKNRKDPLSLQEFFYMVEDHGDGKPLSAREILAIADAVKKHAVVKNPDELTDQGRNFINEWGNELRTVFNDSTLNETNKISKIDEITLNSLNRWKWSYLNDRVREIFGLFQGKLTSLDLPGWLDWRFPEQKDDPAIKLIKETYVRVKNECEKKKAMVEEGPAVEGPESKLPADLQKIMRDFGDGLLLIKNGKPAYSKMQDVYVSLTQRHMPTESEKEIVRIFGRFCDNLTGNAPEDFASFIEQEVAAIEDGVLRSQVRHDPLLKALSRKYDGVLYGV